MAFFSGLIIDCKNVSISVVLPFDKDFGCVVICFWNEYRIEYRIHGLIKVSLLYIVTIKT